MTWEIRIHRQSVQQRASDGKRRTVGTYQVYHDGQPMQYFSIPGVGDIPLFGQTAESKGMGANKPQGNGHRVEKGSYPLRTHAGAKYVTLGYNKNANQAAIPKPGILLGDTDERVAILIHPGIGFLASVGCINLCKNLPNASEPISFGGSRNRVIAMIEDMKNYIQNFPNQNGQSIKSATCTIFGEP